MNLERDRGLDFPTIAESVFGPSRGLRLSRNISDEQRKEFVDNLPRAQEHVSG